MKPTDHKPKIAIFASGSGTNAETVIRHFNTAPDSTAEVALVVSNRPEAGVLQRARTLGVPTAVVTRSELNDPQSVLPLLDKYEIDFVVLAGFLMMIPAFLIERYESRMLNIHPSLLPKFGGKGMYGRHVHEAVVATGETETGITIHLVSERYDEGAILFQASVEVAPDDTPADVEAKVHALEYTHYPRIITRLIARTGR